MGEARDWRVAARKTRMAEALKAFEETGNASEVRRRCGFGKGTICHWRKIDTEFAVQWTKAMAAHESRRITMLAVPPGKPTRLKTKLQRDLLDHIAGTRSVAAAARAIGMDATTVWTLARRDIAFATALSAAINQGYGQIEAELISDCIHGVAPLANDKRERVSDAIRARMVANGHHKAAAREAAASDEAERDRNEAIAARWVAKLLAELDGAA